MGNPAHQRTDIFAFLTEPRHGTKEARHNHLQVADNPQRYRLRKRHWAAHRKHRIADAQFARIPESRGDELAWFSRLKLNDADVGERIASDQFCFDFFAISQRAKNS